MTFQGHTELDPSTRVAAADLRDAWPALNPEERVDGFRFLTSSEAEEFFSGLDAYDRTSIVRGLPPAEQRLWMRVLAPDDAADLIQEAPDNERMDLLQQLDGPTRKEVIALMAYAEDEAGGLMNPRYARLRPEMRVDEAISYLRRQTHEQVENLYYAYVIGEDNKLLGTVSFRELITSASTASVKSVMQTDLIAVREEMDQEELSHLFAEKDLLALPVVDAHGRMQGIVTADDIVDVVTEEATEDIHKIGGSAALDAPYLQISFFDMFKKRAGWLTVLFVGAMLTVSAMGAFEDQLSGVLVLFVPLIISTGGNTGSQASTLVIRAMALGEVRLKDWWRVVVREFNAGLALGLLLGLLGLMRVVFGYYMLGEEASYGGEFLKITGTVVFSVMAVTMWGTLAGALLPFGLRRVGFDPASASAPLVATIVDVTGLVIYFGMASWLLTASSGA